MATATNMKASVRQNLFTRLACTLGAVLLCFRLLSSAGCEGPQDNPGIPAGGVQTPLARKRRRRDEPAEASADYGRFSTDMQDETTIESQQESCRHEAIRHGQPIDPRLEYVDRAVSGTKLSREGLNRLLEDAEAGRFNRLYFYSLSRLARESIIGLPILKRLVYVYKIRIVSVTEGIDSEREGWDQLAQMCLMQHERYVKELSNNTLRGQKSNVKNRYSNGDYCFGYTSVPVPGSDDSRRGRNARPRMMYAIDAVSSDWVRRIFRWFVHERRSIRWITKELNRLGAPKDHRSQTTKWHHNYVARLLANRKYIGDWSWGTMKNVRDPETGVIHQEPRSAEEAEQYRRLFPDLRLIDDGTFAAAQAILAENRKNHAHGRDEEGEFLAGRDGTAKPASHLLNGLIVCGQPTTDGVCGRTFHVGGSNGKYLFCPGHQQGACSCRTTLPRRLAEELILREIGNRILANPAWLEAVFVAMRNAWRERRRTLPNELRDVQAALEETTRKIGRLVDSLEGTGQPDPDVAARLTERRAERRALEARLATAQAAAAEQSVEPTEDWVRERVAQLGATLAEATPAAAYALRDLLAGPITVREIVREGKQRHYLRGTLRVRLGTLAAALGVQTEPSFITEGATCEEITIDFRREDPRDVLCEQAKALWDQNLHNKVIAKRLGCSKAFVTKLLRHWSRRHGVELPDGRTRRGRIPPRAEALPLYQRIAEPVMELYRQGRELADIATELGHDRNTVTAAVRFWHESRGLTMTDGRTRRKTLPRPTDEERSSDEGPSDSSAA
jgi:site-specific DNA recombinase